MKECDFSLKFFSVPFFFKVKKNALLCLCIFVELQSDPSCPLNGHMVRSAISSSIMEPKSVHSWLFVPLQVVRFHTQRGTNFLHVAGSSWWRGWPPFMPRCQLNEAILKKICIIRTSSSERFQSVPVATQQRELFPAIKCLFFGRGFEDQGVWVT